MAWAGEGDGRGRIQRGPDPDPDPCLNPMGKPTRGLPTAGFSGVSSGRDSLEKVLDPTRAGIVTPNPDPTGNGLRSHREEAPIPMGILHVLTHPLHAHSRQENPWQREHPGIPVWDRERQLREEKKRSRFSRAALRVFLGCSNNPRDGRDRSPWKIQEGTGIPGIFPLPG